MAKERKLQIVKAAAKRFARHGLGKTTLEEIARDVRIGKATIYHYFTSKDELFLSSLQWEQEQFIEDIKAIFNNEELPLGARLLEYYSFKETVSEKYKLVYDLLVSILKEDTLEEFSESIKKFFTKEEETVKLILSSVYSGRIETMNTNLPSYIVTSSWGFALSYNLQKRAIPEKIISSKELIFKSLENILS